MKIDIAKLWFLLLPVVIISFFPSKTILFGGTFIDVFILVYLILFSTQPEIKFEFTKIHTYLVLITGFSLISFLVNFSQIQHIKYWLRFPEYFMIFFFTFHFYSSDLNKYFTKGLIIAFVCLFVFGIIQFVFPGVIIQFDWGPEWKEMYVLTKKIRVYSFIDNPLTLVAFVSVLTGYFTIIKIKDKPVVLFFTYLLLLLTGSKIGLVVVLMSLSYFFFKIIRALKIKFKYLIIILFAVVSGVLFILSGYYQKTTIVKRIENKSEVQGSKNQRLLVFESSVNMITDNPVFGIGAGNFENVYTSGYQVEGSSEAESSFTAENFFLDFYLDNGLIPTFLFFNIIFIIFTAKKSDDLILKAISASIFFIMIVGLVTNLRSVPVFMLLFYMIAVFFKRKKPYEIN